MTETKEPKCETCGDTRKKPRKEKQHCRLLLCADLEIPSCWKCRFYIHEDPCPKCTAQEQPPAGEFTKGLRQNVQEFPDFPIHLRDLFEKDILKACKIIDTETQRADKAEAENKRLKEGGELLIDNSKPLNYEAIVYEQYCKGREIFKDLEAKQS